MQGDLDNPPVIIRTARAKAAWRLLGFALLAGFGVYAIQTQISPPWWAYLGALLGVACAGIYGWELISPNVVELSPQGLTVRLKSRKASYAWRDIGTFRIETHTYKGVTSQVSVVFSCWPDDPAKFYRVALGSDWEMANEDIVDLLDAARARWLPT